MRAIAFGDSGRVSTRRRLSVLHPYHGWSAQPPLHSTVNSFPPIDATAIRGLASHPVIQRTSAQGGTVALREWMENTDDIVRTRWYLRSLSFFTDRTRSAACALVNFRICYRISRVDGNSCTGTDHTVGLEIRQDRAGLRKCMESSADWPNYCLSVERGSSGNYESIVAQRLRGAHRGAGRGRHECVSSSISSPRAASRSKYFFVEL